VVANGLGGVGTTRFQRVKSRMSGGNNTYYGNTLKVGVLPNKWECLFTSSTYQQPV